jgi:hypothetical protein
MMLGRMGRLKEAVLHSAKGGATSVFYDGKKREISLKAKQKITMRF